VGFHLYMGVLKVANSGENKSRGLLDLLPMYSSQRTKFQLNNYTFRNYLFNDENGTLFGF